MRDEIVLFRPRLCDSMKEGGRAVCSLGGFDDHGELHEGESMGIPDFPEIRQIEQGFLLVREMDGGDFCGDTFHQTMEEAKRQAEFEFDTGIHWLPES
jgi:hypothetical protein